MIIETNRPAASRSPARQARKKDTVWSASDLDPSATPGAPRMIAMLPSCADATVVADQLCRCQPYPRDAQPPDAVAHAPAFVGRANRQGVASETTYSPWRTTAIPAKTPGRNGDAVTQPHLIIFYHHGCTQNRKPARLATGFAIASSSRRDRLFGKIISRFVELDDRDMRQTCEAPSAFELK
jgi:hypothetical protein